MKTVLSIHSQVAGARVGNSVAAFAMERLGVRVLALPTTLLGRRPDRGAPGGGPVAAETLASLIDALEADGQLPRVDAVLSGYVAAPEQAEIILDAVSRVKAANPAAFYACDPVLGDDGRFYVGPAIRDAVVEKLAPAADWLTPNAFEASALTGVEIASLEDALSVARKLGKPVLISSIPHEARIAALFWTPEGAWAFETEILKDAARGAGDLFAALFLARTLSGETHASALASAMGAVYDVIARSPPNGDLDLPAAQEMLIAPRTQPRAIALEQI